jgi:hypothetical protein
LTRSGCSATATPMIAEGAPAASAAPGRANLLLGPSDTSSRPQERWRWLPTSPVALVGLTVGCREACQPGAMRPSSRGRWL